MWQIVRSGLLPLMVLSATPGLTQVVRYEITTGIPTRGSQPPGPILPATLTPLEAGTIERHQSPKSRVEECLKVASIRLVSAVDNAGKGLYQAAAEQIVVYAALIRYADQVTRGIPSQKRNDRESCLKKVEQAIFRQGPRLDAIAREMPIDYRDSAVTLLEQVKRTRLQAINDLLGGGSAIRVPEEG